MAVIGYYYPAGHQAHSQAGHPERPERVDVMRRALIDAGWWHEPDPVGETLEEDLLHAIHTSEYLTRLMRASREGEYLDADTYTTPQSWDLALSTAGGTAALARAVWRREQPSGFALSRPPGHHASAGRGMGFCLLNNAAIAAEGLLQKEGAKRLAIVDLDLHHGNGTQDIFYSRQEVWFISIHQSPLYPGTGFSEETGSGPGRGATANIPLPPGSGDAAFQAAMEALVLPLLDRCQPEMLLVSLGFDTHWRDPLGSLQTTAGGIGRQIRDLKEWADRRAGGRMIVILEGGYDLRAVAAGTLACTAALRGEAWEGDPSPAPLPETKDWQDVISQARRAWEL